LYLFETSSNDWSCVIGSANFTAAAFSTNTEACLLFDANDDPSGTTKRSLDKAMARYWKSAGYFEPDELKQYRSLWQLFRQRRKGMAGDFDDKKGGKLPLLTPLLKMPWGTYYQRVLADQHHGVDKRMAVLEEARRLFETKGSLSQMSKADRQGIGGFAPDDDVPWGWFGSMFGAGVFKKLVNANSPGLSQALDAIPMRGEVRRDEYLRFIDSYVGAYPGRRRHGLATATRLLAMKRPDYFVCFDAGNRDGLCKAFGISIGHHDYERYWDSSFSALVCSRENPERPHGRPRSLSPVSSPDGATSTIQRSESVQRPSLFVAVAPLPWCDECTSPHTFVLSSRASFLYDVFARVLQVRKRPTLTDHPSVQVRTTG
jgi:hypothetical protein